MSGMPMKLAARRTVRLHSLALTKTKQVEIHALAHTYARAKDRFLLALGPRAMWYHLDDKRGFRGAMKDGGAYPDGVNVHLLDQACFDAVDTMVRHIEAQLATGDVKGKIWRRYQGQELERRFAYTALKRYGWIGELLGGVTPAIESKALAGLDEKARDQVARYLHRVLRKALSGRLPRAHMERSVALDETLYTTSTSHSVPQGHTCEQMYRRCRQGHLRQYVSVVGAKPTKRIVIPLAGVSRVSGNIRVVLDEGDERAVVHVPYAIRPIDEATGPEEAIDWGVTEVCTDSAGVKHGKGLGMLLADFTDKNTRQGRARGKLHATVRNRRKADPGSKKAKHIARNNLGVKKQRARRQKAQAGVRTLAGQAVKGVVYGQGNRTRARGALPQTPSQRPKTLGMEDLSHLRGKAKSKKMSQICSTWMRSENQARMVVHAAIGRTDVKTLNAAYTSQMCPEPTCGFVSRDNRNGDAFHCRNPYWGCNWQGDADHVGAMNLLSRLHDREISVFTHYTEVRKILDGRFRRRKESRTGASGVTGRTATAVKDDNRAAGVEGEATAHGRTPSRPHLEVGGSAYVADSPSPVHVVWTGETQRLESKNKRKPRNA